MRLSAISEWNPNVTRRDFLKKASSVGLAATAPGKAVAGAMKLLNMTDFDPLADISDEDLSCTPEMEWITKIPYSRVLRIIRGQNSYAASELGNKVINIGIYGPGKSQSGDVLKILTQAAKDSGIDMDEVVKSVTDMTRYGANKNGKSLKETLMNASKSADTILKHVREAGLDLPAGRVRNNILIAAKEDWARHLEWAEERKRREGEEGEPKEIDSPHKLNKPHDYTKNTRWDHKPEGSAWFENKLNKILSAII